MLRKKNRTPTQVLGKERCRASLFAAYLSGDHQVLSSIRELLAASQSGASASLSMCRALGPHRCRQSISDAIQSGDIGILAAWRFLVNGTWCSSARVGLVSVYGVASRTCFIVSMAQPRSSFLHWRILHWHYYIEPLYHSNVRENINWMSQRISIDLWRHSLIPQEKKINARTQTRSWRKLQHQTPTPKVHYRDPQSVTWYWVPKRHHYLVIVKPQVIAIPRKMSYV